MIAIKDMKMPKCCDECDFIQRGVPDWCGLRVSMHDIFDDKIRPDWCPLIEIEPVKHSDFYPNADENGMVDVSDYPYTK